MQQFVQLIKNRVVGAKPTASRAEIMASRPVRNPVILWERTAPSGTQTAKAKSDADAAEDMGEVAPLPPVMLLKIPRRSDKWGNFVAHLFKLPEHRKLELDEIGSDVWELCDGVTTVEALNKAVCDKWQMNRRQGETSVTAYLKMLAERRLIAVRKGKAVTAAAAPAKRKGAQGQRGNAPARKKRA